MCHMFTIVASYTYVRQRHRLQMPTSLPKSSTHSTEHIRPAEPQPELKAVSDAPQGHTMSVHTELSGHTPIPSASHRNAFMRLGYGRVNTSVHTQVPLHYQIRRDSDAVRCRSAPRPQLENSSYCNSTSYCSSSTDVRGPAPAYSTLTAHRRLSQRPGRRRLHICAAGGPGKKLGAGTPRGSEVRRRCFEI